MVRILYKVNEYDVNDVKVNVNDVLVLLLADCILYLPQHFQSL